MYHEAFWLATSAAAPVIALAAVVAYSDAAEHHHQRVNVANLLGFRGMLVGPARPGNPAAGVPATIGVASRKMAVVAGPGTCLVNLAIQAVVLAFSLASLANETDEASKTWVIAATVGGIALLTFAAWESTRARGALSEAWNFYIENPPAELVDTEHQPIAENPPEA